MRLYINSSNGWGAYALGIAHMLVVNGVAPCHHNKIEAQTIEHGNSKARDYIIEACQKKMEFRSLLERLAHHPEPGVSESPDNAHFYVECKSWNTANQIALSIFGHTDEDAKEFSYSLTYDIQKDLLQK